MNVIRSFTLCISLLGSLTLVQAYLPALGRPCLPLSTNFRNLVLKKSSMQLTEKTYVRRGYEENGLALDDFGQILEGVYLYGQVFGDFDIPVKFEIPAEEPWPSLLHGLRLGRRLEKILGSEEFFQKHPEKVRELEKLGFEPSLDSLLDEWALMFKTMQAYKQIYGDLRISSKFIVPDTDEWPRYSRNLKLGVRVAAIRSAGRYVKDHPTRKQQLDEMGFEWRIRDHTHKQQLGEDIFEQVLEALNIYKVKVDRGLQVPNNFVVPADEHWPSQLHGLKLGFFVQGIRNEDKLIFGREDRRQQLNDLGFSWAETGRSSYSNKRFDLIYSALAKYKELNGDLLVPQVPENDDSWPEETWGLKLGARTNAIRAQGTFVANSPERRAMLDELGFNWEIQSSSKKKKAADNAKAMAAAVDAFQKGAGRKVIEQIDANPSETKPPEFTTADLLKQEAEKDKKAGSGGTVTFPSASARQLRGQTNTGRIGGVAKSVLDFDLSLIFEPVTYREIAAGAIGEYLDSRDYSSDPDVRQTGHFEGYLSPQAFSQLIARPIATDDVKSMIKEGYRILDFGRFSWDHVKQALTTYHEIFGNVNVPHDFVIDENILELYPQHQDEDEIEKTTKAPQKPGFDPMLEDLPLGEAVASLRCGDIDGLEETSRRKFLDSLGFDWGDMGKYQRYRFVPMLLGLKLYNHLYGFPLVDGDFVVPTGEPQWPFWMSGMPLGEWVTIARIQQQMIAEHYPHRKEMLDAMEFLWWIPPKENFPTKYFRQVK